MRAADTKPHALFVGAEEFALGRHPLALVDSAGRPTTGALVGAAALRSALDVDPDAAGVGVVTGGHDADIAFLAVDYPALPDAEKRFVERTLDQYLVIETGRGLWLFPFRLDSDRKPWESPPPPAPHSHNIEPVRVLRNGDVVPLPPSRLDGGPLSWRRVGGSNGRDFTLASVAPLTIAVASLLGATWTLGARRATYTHPMRSWRCPS